MADTRRPAGTIMLGSDDVVIRIKSSNLSLHVAANNQHLTCGGAQPLSFKFSALTTDFEVDDDSDGVEDLRAISQNVNGGDRWELTK